MNSPTNSSPEDIAQVAAAFERGYAAAQAVQAQGSFGTPMTAESTQQPEVGAKVSVT
jgi:hypothetical protein